ncbi:MAG: ATP-dependent DNA helicase [Patescibacteria group bacterium]|jgi:DNA helicase-2/ATP-dependent DNA helicase PcrA
MENKKTQLNKEQEAAVLHGQGPLLIVAGAGTGKTCVITERIVNLINSGLAQSSEILALTFTEKAAGEMVERVDRLLPLGYYDLNISTFHSFCQEVLNDSGLDIGLPTNFKLLNEFEQYSLFKKHLDRFGLIYYQPMGNPTKFIREILKHISRCKDEDITPLEYLCYAEELRQDLDGMLGAVKGSKKGKSNNVFLNSKGEFDREVAEQEVKKIEEVANAYHIYQNLLLENNALDFGDLINYCLKLFRERPNVLEKYRARFKYILVDEFQDTNWAQYELVKMLAAPQNNITVVGDDDQSVYRFRGAAMANILEFKKDYPDCQQVFLRENYRSAQEILNSSYEFIKLNNPNRLEAQLASDGSGLSKKLKSNISDKGLIEVIRGADIVDELARVVKKIADIKTEDKEAKWSDFAILARANDPAKEICSYLDEAGFPYKLNSSRGLYAKEEILNSIAYLTALSDYYDGVALYKSLSLPVFGLTVENLTTLNYLVYKKGSSLYKILNEAAAMGVGSVCLTKVNKFLAVFKKHLTELREKSAGEMFLSFLNDSGYLKYLTSLGGRREVEASNLLNQFMRRIKSFEANSGDKSVRAFLNELLVEIEAGEQGTLPFDEGDSPDTIKIMTVHASKGLEFKYVFIINLIDKRFPSIERSESIKIPDALLDEKLPEGDHHLEEERRLFYVAMTRAKKGLYLSWSSDAGGKRERRASRFLVETGLVEDLTLENSEDDKITPLLGGVPEGRGGLLEVKPVVEEKNKEEKFIPKAPERFSYSQFAAYEKCPYQYRFANVLKIPVHGKPSFSFGKTMHATFQKILQIVQQAGEKTQDSLFNDPAVGTGHCPVLSLEECYKVYAESWEDDWYPSEKLKEEYRANGKRIVKEFYEEHKDNWPKVLFLEKGFSLRMKVDGEGITIAGKIDRIDETPDGKLRIIDYKTGSPKEKLTFEDKAQLLIYQTAAKQFFHQEVGALVFRYLEDGSEIEFLGKDKDFEKLDEKICEAVRAIRSGEFPPKPVMCKYCDFNGICEYRKL